MEKYFFHNCIYFRKKFKLFAGGHNMYIFIFRLQLSIGFFKNMQEFKEYENGLFLYLLNSFGIFVKKNFDYIFKTFDGEENFFNTLSFS